MSLSARSLSDLTLRPGQRWLGLSLLYRTRLSGHGIALCGAADTHQATDRHIRQRSRQGCYGSAMK